MPHNVDSVSPSKEPIPISAEPIQSKEVTADSTLSTIEKSKHVDVAAWLVPILSFIMLEPPKNVNGVDELSPIIVRTQALAFNFLIELNKQKNGMTQELLDRWSKNLQEIKEAMQKIINSPQYQALEKLKKEETSGISHATHANVTLDRLDKLDHNLKENAFTYTLLFYVGGGLALGEVDPKNNTEVIIDRLVGFVTPMASHLSVQDLIPVINLMVMAPIFYRFLDEAVSNIKNKSPQDTSAMINQFAKSVIKMVGDPSFALLSVVNNAEKIDQLSPKQKLELAAMMKLILASIALSLLYAMDVGKAKGNQFLGMEIKEFRALLNGTIQFPPINEKSGEGDLMRNTLLNQIKFLLDVELAHIPQQIKDEFMDGLFEFLSQGQKLDGLITPAKDFSQILIKVMERVDYKIPLPKMLYA